MVSTHQHLGPNHDARNTLDACRRRQRDKRGEASHGYHPHRGRNYNSGEDQSPSLDPSRPQAFGWRILNVAFPSRYRSPTNISKYSGEMNPSLWLEDYWLACRASSVDSDYFIFRNLPLFLANSARTRLEHLLPNQIQSWADLKEVFVGNFQGTYTRPRNPKDL
jgi:hypothetical protein